MRFIHAADIHLDSPLTGLSAYADAPAEMLRGATRQAFSNLVSAAIDERVDFMVIAGDLYDGPWKDHNTGLYFCKEMGRLQRAGIPVYLLFGNHDAESEMTRKLEWPSNVHVFPSGKAGTHRLDDLRVALHGRSFKVAATTENLVTHYPPPVPGFFNIGVLHTALEGNAQHAAYAPCSVPELHAKGYQYWALGHVHEFAQWTGDSVIVFPGNLQGRHIRETGPRGAVLVSCDEAGHVEVDRLYVDVLRWHRVDVDVSACATFSDVTIAVGEAIESLIEASRHGLPQVARVVVSGRTAAHGALFGLEHVLRQEVLAKVAALGQDRLWVEKVVLATQPAVDAATLAGRADALAELHEVLRQAESDEAFLQDLQTQLLGLVSRAPLELHDAVPWFDAIRSGELSDLVSELRPSLLAYLETAE